MTNETACAAALVFPAILWTACSCPSFPPSKLVAKDCSLGGRGQATVLRHVTMPVQRSPLFVSHAGMKGAYLLSSRSTERSMWFDPWTPSRAGCGAKLSPRNTEAFHRWAMFCLWDFRVISVETRPGVADVEGLGGSFNYHTPGQGPTYLGVQRLSCQQIGQTSPLSNATII
jgi:hypothetical protein